MARQTYNPDKSRQKGLKRAGSATVSGAVVTLAAVATAIQGGASVETALQGGGIGAAVTLINAAIQGWLRWRKNRKKHKRGV